MTESADIRKQLAVFAGYTAIGFIVTYPLILNFSSILGPAEDNQMFIWNIWWFKYSIFNLGVSPFHTEYLFFPEGADLLFHTFSSLNCVFALILIPLLGIIASYNVLILLTFIIGAYGGYLLARELGLCHQASFIAGIVFSFNPFHLAHAAHHLNISSIQFMPFLLLFTIKACNTGNFKHIIIASLFLAANFYIGYYTFMFSMLLLIPLLFVPFGKTTTKKRFQQIKPLIYILVIGVILTFPLLLPAAREAVADEFRRSSDYHTFVVDLGGLLFPHKYHWTKFLEINQQVNMSYKGNYWESVSFLGFAVSFLTIWTVLKRKFRFKIYFIVIGLMGVILALGAYPHFMGRSFSFFKLPYYILQYIPGINAARTPGRFIILTYLALSVLSSVTIDYLLRALGARRGKIIKSFAFVIILFVVLSDYWSSPFEMSEIKVAAFYQTIKSQPDDFAVMNLPAGSRKANLRYMYYQTIHQKPICAGQLARSWKSFQNYNSRWREFDMTPESLKAEKIRYIVLHGDFLPPATYLDYKKQLVRRFRFIAEESNSALFEAY